MPFLIVAAVAALISFLAGRSRELFRITIADGKQTVVRGRVPPALLNDFGAVVRRVKRGRVIAHKASSGARLTFGGDIEGDVAQRLRNIFGLYPMARPRR